MPPLPDPDRCTDTTLALLAGGAGARMGQPKSLLRVGEKPLLVHLLERLNWCGPTLLVTAPGRERPPGAERFEREVVDAVSDQGPARGLLTALEHLATPLLVAVAVDMPGITRVQIDWLAAALRARQACAGVMTRRGDDGAFEPFPCALRPEAAAVIRRALSEGRRSLQSLVQPGSIEALPAPDWPAEVWTNLNDQDQWKRWLTASAEPGR